MLDAFPNELFQFSLHNNSQQIDKGNHLVDQTVQTKPSGSYVPNALSMLPSCGRKWGLFGHVVQKNREA